MSPRLWRSKWLIAIIVITLLATALLSVVWMKLDYIHENDAVLEYFLQQPGMSDAFANLTELTPSGSVVLCWWDYGRAVRQWSHREVIEAYPSKDIWNSVGTSKTLIGNLKAQLFGTWGSSERIHDLARIFMQSEELALALMSKYNVKYALVFLPDELQKFSWIAEIAGYNATNYLTYKGGDTYQPTTRAAEVTLLRLLFDDTLHPQYFTRLFDNLKAKIYRVNYP